MTRTAAAAATGLPTARRCFLGQLASLPLIGGAVSLIGQPSAVAEPVTLNLMEAYKTWLHFEHRAISWEMAAQPEIVEWYGGTRTERSRLLEAYTTCCSDVVGRAAVFHNFGDGDAASRAALVLSAVGCDWRASDRLARAVRSSASVGSQA